MTHEQADSLQTPQHPVKSYGRPPDNALYAHHACLQASLRPARLLLTPHCPLDLVSR